MKITFIGSGDAGANGGRNQTCILAEDEDTSFLVDCGPASLAALKKSNFDINKIDFIVNTHMHGDHYGGIPFLLLDYDIFQKRTKELCIYGPKNLDLRLTALSDLLFNGYNINRLSYKISFQPLEADKSVNTEHGYQIESFLMNHSAYSDCLGHKITKNGKSFAYTGDTAWTENIIRLAENTDLFICESSLYEKSERVKHCSYHEIKENQNRIKTKRLILTHLSPEILDKKEELEIESSYDGMEIII